MFGFEWAITSTPRITPRSLPRCRWIFRASATNWYAARGRGPPVADAGPNHPCPPGTVTLNGSGSYDPLGEALTYSWTQTAGPIGHAFAPTASATTFTAAAGQVYSFRSDGAEYGWLAGYGKHYRNSTTSRVRRSSLSSRPSRQDPGRTKLDPHLGDPGRNLGRHPRVGSGERNIRLDRGHRRRPPPLTLSLRPVRTAR